jgi:hypothetical protein
MHLIDTALMPAALMIAQEHIPMQDFPRRETVEAQQVHATDANSNLPNSNLPQRLSRPLQAGGVQVAEGGRNQEKENIAARNVPAAHTHVALTAACPGGHASNVPGPALSARSPARQRGMGGGRQSLSATTPASKSISNPTAIDLDSIDAYVQEAGVCAVAAAGSGAESQGGEHKRTIHIAARIGSKVGASADQTGGVGGRGCAAPCPPPPPGSASSSNKNLKKRSLEHVKQGSTGTGRGDVAAHGAGGSDDDDFKTHKPRPKLLHVKRK